MFDAVPFVLVLATMTAEAESAKPTAQQLEFFENKIRPVLAEHCYSCHAASANPLQASLYLDRRSGHLRGGDCGPAIVPGKPEESNLILAIRYDGDFLDMPPKGKLPASAIADLTRWVEMGAPWPEEKGSNEKIAKEEFDVATRKAAHWAWSTPSLPALPKTKDTDWIRDDLDAFVLQRLEDAGLEPAPRADRRTLIRRLSFDLIGLPPTSEDVKAFDSDPDPDAYAKLVERLLSSPHFGERWGRHWLDLVRYAETRGHEWDHPVANAYQYRDYVIRAFNADVPYDQFVKEHIAGDLLERPRRNPTRGFNESILGTGFWFLGEWVHSPVDIRQDETDRFDNMIDVMSKTFLGMTVACARCHDHKFDAISAEDYYSLAGFLQSSSYRQVRFETMDHHRQLAEELAALREQSERPLANAITKAAAPQLDRLADYLLAARRRIRPSADDAGLEGGSEAGLDPSLINQWVAHLRHAKKDPSDPFHAWSLLAHHTPADAKRRLEKFVARIEHATNQSQQWLDRSRSIVDYAAPDKADWLEEGYSFGGRPRRVGESRVGEDPSWPFQEVHAEGAAVYDPFWKRLRLAKGTERESGKPGSWVQAGRTLRTPTFKLQEGRLHYRVRGDGVVFAVVDSHRMVQGPLHGRVIKTVKAGPTFRWIEHDLTPYIGHGIHLEFSPADDSSEFAVAMVREGDQPPPAEFSTNSLIGEIVEQSLGNPPTSLARAYRRTMRNAAQHFASGFANQTTRTSDWSALADWLVRHPELVSTSDGRDSAREASKFYFQKTSALADRLRPESHTAPAMMDGNGVEEYVLIRGNHKTVGDVAPRRFLEALEEIGQPNIAGGSGRLELAHRIVDPANPLVARVIVNRLWAHLTGRGLVPSVDNLGVLGSRPSHPRMLDFLAKRLIAEDWSLKQAIRHIVLSNTYQMASRPSDGRAEELDPKNDLLHRMPIRRLEAEAIRDAILTVSGRLDPTLFGPSVEVHLTPFMQGRGRPRTSGPLDGNGRRSIYTRIRRNFLPPMLTVFDMPIPYTTVGRRTVSNVPAQALTLMNDPFVSEQASLWAERVLATPDRSPKQRVERLYQSAFSRPPSDKETRAALSFLEQHAENPNDEGTNKQAWADLCHVLFNVKEFIFIN
ncbi:Planctomycete cytochrome C [Planctomycetes bacterium Pan216]|uniref:Planctomycete cytochrome C n=1 Tax=Kolteria novifilia TaxID=2527975 RepID=A0A518B1G5_9BACT|nr:Planctomycete cytochrome C [Planctomycetes bacterium Pan216]